MHDFEQNYRLISQSDDDGLINAESQIKYINTILVHYLFSISTLHYWYINKYIIIYTQNCKTATRYWMDNPELGYYTFEVHYKSTPSITMSASKD